MPQKEKLTLKNFTQELPEKVKQVIAKEKTKDLFRNPYNFIPALPRDSKEVSESPFCDQSPASHSSYNAGSWSGRIAIKLTTKTPMLIPDAAKAETIEDAKKGHLSFPLRKVNGMPCLAATSIKGLLRSAYEAVTNSRMGVFHDHDARLAYRMIAEDGLSLVPARICGDGKSIQLMMGKTNGLPTPKPSKGWHIPKSLMYAAWLPQYSKHSANPSKDAFNFDGMHHGQAVKAWVQKIDRGVFSYWRVCPNSLVPNDRELSQKPEIWEGNQKHKRLNEEPIKVEGYLCITGKNINKKHDERLFFMHPENNFGDRAKITPSDLELRQLKKAWSELITNYQEVHEREIDNDEKGPSQAKDGDEWTYKWSHHITRATDRRRLSKAKEATLEYGRLCYAKANQVGDELKVEALYPVMIARKLFGCSPDDILSSSLKPASTLAELSPADRVFGWANQEGNGAHKGQLRIHSVKCYSATTTKHTTKSNTAGLALGILGQPKPTQTRFYTAKDKAGSPLEGVQRQKGYKKNHGLRGRKVYPHQVVDDSYWKENVEEKEYARPVQTKEGRDSQNRSIQEWVDPNAEFLFQIDVVNLSETEIGALLWLLTIPEDHYHRLGGGKPFGFGSVSLEIVDWEEASLRTGDEWKSYYSDLQQPSSSSFSKSVADELIKKFEIALKKAYSKNKGGQIILDSFLRMAQGYDDSIPVHYPRMNRQSTVKAENFKWFEKNEKDKKLALPSLLEDQGLPLFAIQEKQPEAQNRQPPKSAPNPTTKKSGSVPPPILKKNR